MEEVKQLIGSLGTTVVNNYTKNIAYSHKEIEDVLGSKIEQKRTEYDVLPLQELRKLLDDGWVIFDTSPVIGTEDIKILTLAKG